MIALLGTGSKTTRKKTEPLVDLVLTYSSEAGAAACSYRNETLTLTYKVNCV